MSIIKLVDEGYESIEDMGRIIRYVMDPSKNRFNFYGGIGASFSSVQDTLRDFIMVKKAWHKEDKRQLVHFIVAFAPFWENEIEYEEAYYIGYQIAMYIGERFQIVFALHDDHYSKDGSLHIHFIVNTVSYIDGYKFIGGRQPFFKLKDYLRSVLPFDLEWQIFYGDEDDWKWKKQLKELWGECYELNRKRYM
ncbi:relaxase/mobilization nuclease-like protein [Mobilisporobacter senegalensis]|uniref:Relaxase/mobilization nuclease-like protein n=1 Tax=Mobilisporobacter senegalensis TaxID=1329262 RepID=A0A3N1XPB4_9FIRM|nr:relaxase/mobilization nuclease domain-containing protein [Mobilisporobacter senegalensis]ROR28514.1 relaxase/mobilization nuclease-like protein [Mobilisporobacter senegalensis]